MTAKTDHEFQGIDHVQLAAPPGCEAEARRFFGQLLGLTELPKPAVLAVRGGVWFACGSQQVHIGVEKDFQAARKAHPAFRLSGEAALGALRERLVEGGVTVRDGEPVEDTVRFFADDPWGNRLEFLAERERARV
ncbi:MAG TPA: VOC family protein [Polyangiaceae bacterium]